MDKFRSDAQKRLKVRLQFGGQLFAVQPLGVRSCAFLGGRFYGLWGLACSSVGFSVGAGLCRAMQA
jgi:hypothetical protein